MRFGQFLLHYHAERDHRGLGNTIIDPTDDVGGSEGDIMCKRRLGGLLRHYRREAA
jgi:hypothetical protein